MNHIVYEPYGVHELESTCTVTLVDSLASLLVTLHVCSCTVLSIYSYCCVTIFGDDGSLIMAHMAFGHIDPDVKGIPSYLERVGFVF